MPRRHSKAEYDRSHTPVKKRDLAEAIKEIKDAEAVGSVLPELLEPSALELSTGADARWLVYLKNLENGARIGAAAKAAGITYRAVCQRRAVDPSFVKEERLAESQAVEVIENELWKVAKGGNLSAILFILQNRDPTRWKDMRRPDRQVLQVVEGNVNVVDANSSMDAVGALIEKLDERRRARELPPDTGMIIDVDVDGEGE